MLFRSLLLLLMAVAGFSADISNTDDYGPGPLPAGASIYSGGAIPATTQVIYSNGTALTGDSAFTRVAGGASALIVDPSLDAVAAIGYGKQGFVAGGTSGDFYLGQTANFTTSAYALRQTAGGITVINGKTGQTVQLAIAAAAKVTLAAATLTVASGTTYVGSDTTDGTSGTAGAINTLGGIGVTKAGWFGTNVTLANGLYAQTVTDATTNTFTNLLTLNHASSGTVAASFGTRILFNLTDDAAVNRNAAGILTAWQTATSGAQTSALSIQTVTAGVGPTTALTVTTAGITIPNGILSQTITDAITNTNTAVGTFTHLSSGTVANGFGVALKFNGHDDGATNRSMGQVSVVWTTAASATRTSAITFSTSNNAAGLVEGFRVGGASCTFASGFPVTISDATASTTAGTGCLILSGGLGVAGAMTITGAITSGGNVQGNRMMSNGNATTALATGIVGMWRSGGTIGVAGDEVFQSDLAVDSNFVFRAGITTPATICTLSPGFPAGTTPGLAQVGTSTITGGVTDGYTASHRLSPVYNGAFTITRHDYFDINQVTGTSTVTDAPLFRFDAAIGTHKTVNSGTTKTSPGTVTAWIVININGTLHYIPCYASKTSMLSPVERAARASIAFPTEPCERISYASAEAA